LCLLFISVLSLVPSRRRLLLLLLGWLHAPHGALLVLRRRPRIVALLDLKAAESAKIVRDGHSAAQSFRHDKTLFGCLGRPLPPLLLLELLR
jgi:hypothetical protein